MHVIRLGRGSQWTVYAVCSDEEVCPLLDFIAELDPKRGNKILSDLQQYVPQSESREWAQSDFSWKFKGTKDILEFRWPTRKGGTPRVLWFYDVGKIIVCSHGVMKKGSIDEAEIRHAESVAAAYRDALKHQRLTVIDYTEFTADDADEENEHE